MYQGGEGKHVCRCRKGVARYIVSPIAYLVYSYFIILDYLLRIKPDVVLLDITHGVNYMPMLTRGALAYTVDIYLLVIKRYFEALFK